MLPQLRDRGFKEVMNTMIAKGRHGERMQQLLDDHRVYVDFMEKKGFINRANGDIFTIVARFSGRSPVWRKIEIRGDQTLADLATSIIHSMGWQEDHLHGFWFPDERRVRHHGDRGLFHKNMEDDPHPTYKTNDIQIAQIHWEAFPKIGFAFDFGESHEFDIEWKSVRPLTGTETRDVFPLLIDQRGVAPKQYPDEEDDIDTRLM